MTGDVTNRRVLRYIDVMSNKNLITTFTSGYNRLFLMARRLLGNDDDAQDALQEAFCRLWPDAEALRTEADAERLSFTTVRNISIDMRREQTAHPAEELGNLSDTPIDEADQQRAEQYRLINTLIRKRLTPLQQRILRLHDVEGRSYQAIAQAEGMQEAAVRMQLSRARKTIRNCYYKTK